ncbi:MAG: hypothetical protein Q8O14_05965 [bacterium]|jgi:hypothetical protein|nr:hypothetical protein [bacterium]
MESPDRPAARRPGLRPEMLVAVLAVVISLSTLAVYVYQSSLMKQQQQMSVWPYLVFGPSWGEDYLRVTLVNKGIGPAIIQHIACSVDQQPLADLHGIMGLLPDSLRVPYRYSSLWPGQVVMVGESMDLLTVEDPVAVRHLLSRFQSEGIRFEICYASVYGETWTSFGTGVRAGACGD